MQDKKEKLMLKIIISIFKKVDKLSKRNFL